jgi:AraC-like DNA-binding protein
MLLGKSRRFDYWLGLFPISLLRRFCPNSPASMLLQDDPRGCFCRDLSDSSAGRLCSVFDQAIAWRDPSTRDAGLGFALLAAWEEYSTSREHVGQNIHPSVSQAIQIICDEIESIGLDEIAERVDLSAQYLSKLFKEQTGMTLSRFRNKRRIERFLQTTAAGSGRSSVLERALEAGFGSYPQFHRVFSEEMGCTPTQFRTRVRMKRK